MDSLALNPFDGKPFEMSRRQFLQRKALTEKSVVVLEWGLLVGVCKSSQFYKQTKQLDVAPHFLIGSFESRRGDFLVPRHNRAYAMIADWRDVNEGVDTIGPELLDVIEAACTKKHETVLQPGVPPPPPEPTVSQWLKPELSVPEWDDPQIFFNLLESTAFREWRCHAVSRYEFTKLQNAASTQRGVLPPSDIEAALKRIQQASQPVRILPSIIDVIEFRAREIPEPIQLVKDLWHKGAKMELGGASKTYKSWILYDLALALQAGQPWLGFATTKSKVLLINFELGDYFSQSRIKRICEARDIQLELGQFDILNLRGFAAGYDVLIPKILQRIRESGREYDVILFDPAYKLYKANMDENSAADVGALLNALEGLACETGAGVAFSAHFSKGNQSSKQSIDRVSGSGVFGRDPDALLSFTAHKEEYAYTVEPTLRNCAPIEAFVVKWQFPRMVRVDLNPEALKRPISSSKSHFPEDLLQVLPPAGLRDGDWLRSSGKTDGTFYRLKRALMNTGRVFEESGFWKPFDCQAIGAAIGSNESLAANDLPTAKLPTPLRVGSSNGSDSSGMRSL